MRNFKPLHMITMAAAAMSFYLATLSNPTQLQKGLGQVANGILLCGSQLLLQEPKYEDKDRNNKK